MYAFERVKTTYALFYISALEEGSHCTYLPPPPSSVSLSTLDPASTPGPSGQ